MWEILTKPIVLIFICAVGYAASTFAMKTASTEPGAIVAVSIAACLAAAALAEIILLQRVHLGLSYVAILGAETLIVLAVAAWLGEGLGTREWFGALLVLAGAGVISA
jgi:drug/metabolite transporter (DMT)-like permease